MKYIGSNFGIFLATGVAMALSACVATPDKSINYTANNVDLNELPLAKQPPAEAVYTTVAPVATNRPTIIGHNTEPHIIQKGHIYMRRQVAYVPPPAPEAIEAKINRVVATRLQTSEAKLKAYAEQQAETKAKLFADQRMAEAKNKIAEAMDAAARAEARSKQYTEQRLASTEKQVANAALAAKNAEAKAIAFAKERLRIAEKQIAEAKQASMQADAKTRELTEKRLHEAQLQISELKLQAQLAEERAKRYTSEKLLTAQDGIKSASLAAKLAETKAKAYADSKFAETEKQVLAVKKDTSVNAEKTKAYVAERLAKTDSALARTKADNAIYMERTASILKSAIEKNANETALALQKTQNAIVNSVASNRQTAKEIQSKLDSQAKELRLAADLAEERAKRYTSEKLLTAQDKIKLASLNAELAEARAKAYADKKYADNYKQLVALEKATSKANADIRQTSAKQIQELENRTKALIASVSKREAGAVEDKLKTYANQQLAKVEDRTMNAVLAVHKEAMLSNKLAKEESLARAEKIANAKAKEVEAKLKAYTEQKTQDAITTSAITMQQLAEETLASAEGHLTKMAQKARVSDSEIKAITESTLADSSDVIRALALQTLADSEDYIKTVARSAVQDDDPAMKKALASAARQVILDEDNNVAFAIKSIVDDAIEEKADTLVAKANVISHDGQIASIEDLDSDRLKIGELSEPGSDTIAMHRPTHREDWVNIRDYHVVVHEDNKDLKNLLKEVLAQAEPFVGPWELKLKISKKNEDIMNERFSLDAETTFEQFANYLAQYIFNSRGVPLSFSMFDEDRVLVLSDE